MATIIIAVGLAQLPAVGGAPVWTVETPLPRAVAGHAAALHAAALIVVGGSAWSADEKQIDDTVQRFDPAPGRGWTALARLPDGFAHGGWAGAGDALWLAGGIGRDGPSRAVRRIDLATGGVHAGATLPEPRVYGGAALLDGALWLVGGTADDKDLARARPTLWRIDLATQTLRALPDAGPAMINPLVLSLGGELHVLPGGVWSAANRRLEPPADVWILSPRSERWTRRPLPVALPRGLSGAPLDAHRALLAGGFATVGTTGAIDARTWIYDARDGSLAPRPPLPAPRLAPAMIPDGHGGAVLLGGEDRPRSRTATVWHWSDDPGGSNK